MVCFSSYRNQRDIHSFPTRRSSDLKERCCVKVVGIFVHQLAHGVAILLGGSPAVDARGGKASGHGDRKSTRLNSSHMSISYAVFCLKKKTSESSPAARRAWPCEARS